MKIIFITAGLEIGRDGVADYTWLLAKECHKQGHTSAILSWNDSFLEATEEIRLLELDGISVLRISSRLQLSHKENTARSFIEARMPDWISVQMVNFGFHPRGWIFGLGKTFKRIIPEKVKVEIMFHELWIGMASNHPWKEKIQGWIQKRALKGFWELLSPRVVHVSNNVYYSQLLQLGLPVRYLPLPSNIAIHTDGSQEWILEALGLTQEQRRNSLVLLFFGSIHGRWNISAFFEKILHLVGQKKVYVLSVGSQGYGSAHWDEMAGLENKKLHFVKLGFRTDGEVSELLQFADAGVSTNAWSLLGKSGTAMAMIEHGLPVIGTRDELRFPFPIKKVEENYPHVYKVEELNESDLSAKTLPIGSRMEQIGQRFLLDLTDGADEHKMKEEKKKIVSS